MTKSIIFDREGLRRLVKENGGIGEDFVRSGEVVAMGWGHTRIADDFRMGNVDDAGEIRCACFHPTNSELLVVRVSGKSDSLRVGGEDTEGRKETLRLVGEVVEGTEVVMYNQKWERR